MSVIKGYIKRVDASRLSKLEQTKRAYNDFVKAIPTQIGKIETLNDLETECGSVKIILDSVNVSNVVDCKNVDIRARVCVWTDKRADEFRWHPILTANLMTFMFDERGVLKWEDTKLTADKIAKYLKGW